VAPKKTIEIEQRESATVDVPMLDGVEARTVRVDLDMALASMAGTMASARPFDYRVEAAANGATGLVVDLYGAELGSRSEAIRDLLKRGAASLLAERA
jgi:hypothetical protein